MRLDNLTDPVLLWDTFKRETDAAQYTIGVRPRAIQSFISQEILETTDACLAARPTGDREIHRSHVRKTRSLFRRDKEQFIRSLAEEVEGHFLVNDLHPAAVQERWAEYFEQLYQVDPPTVNLDAGSAEIPLPDPPISEDPPFLTEIRGTISKLKSGKAAGYTRDHLLSHQRLEQSGFTPGKPTIDRILALRVIVKGRCEFGCGLLAAYIDLKKAFDTVHRESLWEILRLKGIPMRIIGHSKPVYWY
ncbi:uncharacterized protein [Penaeus vannamei]|uniref:uncharacterized protein n=1 Tax=Penaeus vannamei TaxID=6689 RepID=UPI00387F51F8